MFAKDVDYGVPVDVLEFAAERRHIMDVQRVFLNFSVPMLEEFDTWNIDAYALHANGQLHLPTIPSAVIQNYVQSFAKSGFASLTDSELLKRPEQLDTARSNSMHEAMKDDKGNSSHYNWAQSFSFYWDKEKNIITLSLEVPLSMRGSQHSIHTKL